MWGRALFLGWESILVGMKGICRGQATQRKGGGEGYTFVRLYIFSVNLFI